MVTRQLVDPTHCVLSAFTHLWFWRKLTIVHCITSQPENVSSDVLRWHVRRSPIILLQFERETFRPTVWGVELPNYLLGVGDRPAR